MKTLKIVDGQTFGKHIDETIDEDNLFYHEYTIAASYLNNIWINQDGIISGKLKTYFDVPEYPNNVIAFCGDRGTGKSSAMATFVNELKKTKNKENILNFIDDVRDNDWDTNIIIDPSMFDGVHNIIDVVLAHLYQSFKKAYDKDNQKINNYEREKVLGLLSKAYKSLSIIKNTDKMLDDEYDISGNISKLQKLGESTSLKQTLKDLIDLYLSLYPKLVNDESRRPKRLLIAIDDLDLCNEFTYELAEQVRKYLILPNTIILIAVKIEQLELGVEEKNRGDFRNIIAGRKEDSAINQKLKDMSERYVTKLIPKARRIYLPELESRQVNLILKTSFQVDNIKTNREVIEDAVIRLIREKTGMIFIPSTNFENYFLPGNLRELVNLIMLLESMQYPESSEDQDNVNQTRLDNLYEFQSYFIEDMLKKNIELKIAEELLEIVRSNDNIKNLNMSALLESLLSGDMQNGNGFNRYEYGFPNTSLANVMEKMDIISKHLTRTSYYQFYYYIKIYYTILLNERLCAEKNISIPLTGGFIWGNLLTEVMPAAQLDNKHYLNRERFLIHPLTCWNTIAKSLCKWNPNIELEKKDDTKSYVSLFKGDDKLEQVVCWILLALVSTPVDEKATPTRVYRGQLVYDNFKVANICISIENYLMNLCFLDAFYETINFELMKVDRTYVNKIISSIKLNNKEIIEQVKKIVINTDLSNELLIYCINHKGFKNYSTPDRTYKLVQRFFTNINAFFTDAGLESMDLSRLWLPVRIDDQGEVVGADIDICRIYSDIFAVQEQKTKDGLKEYESNNSNTLYTVNDVQQWKQKFVQQVSNVASQDYTRKVGTIPSFLKNKTSKYAKEKLETIANGIQKFSFKEKKLPDNFDPERIIRLYYGIVDQLLKDPASSISDQQAAEYKDIAEIRKVIGN